MLLVKFKKVDSFAFCSYLSCRDVIIQTMRRAGISVEYSQGFNPHELLYFSPPTALGVASECEYVTIYANDCENFKERFNNNAPNGLQVIWAKNIDKRPDFYNLIDYAKYSIKVDAQSEQFNIDNINYDVFDDKKQAYINIKQQIASLSYSNGIFEAIIECGQKKHLKIANLLKCLKNTFNIEVLNIVKVELYQQADKLFAVDEKL